MFDVTVAQGGSDSALPPLVLTARRQRPRSDGKVLSTFSGTHGFAKGGTGAAAISQVAEAGLKTGGADYLRITTDAAGQWGYVRKTGLTPVDMTQNYIGLYVRVPDLSLLSILGVYYAAAGGLAAGNYWSFNSAVWNQYQPAGGENLRPNEWIHCTIPYENRGLTGTATDAGGANPPTAITEWQVAFNAKAGQACEIHLSGLLIYPNTY